MEHLRDEGLIRSVAVVVRGRDDTYPALSEFAHEAIAIERCHETVRCSSCNASEFNFLQFDGRHGV